jgi:hypothetical protein
VSLFIIVNNKKKFKIEAIVGIIVQVNYNCV